MELNVDVETDQNISFAWWNTSLSPSSKSRGKIEDQNIARDVILYLINISEVDFLALGETSEEDFEYFKQHCQVDGYEFRAGTSNIGRSKFDTCYLFNSRKILISDFSNIVSQKGNSKLKIAQRLDLIIPESESIIHIFVSHWPSRLWCDKNDSQRDLLGIRLRDEIDSLIKEYRTAPYIVLLGDYNDEPFDQSLSEQVMATRDLNLATKKSHLLYNPFWKHLSSQSIEFRASGSYFYKSGKLTQWHTFDQVIFSHAFLVGNDWKLCGDVDHIINVPGYVNAVEDTSTIFDHLPVIGKIKRVKAND